MSVLRPQSAGSHNSFCRRVRVELPLPTCWGSADAGECGGGDLRIQTALAGWLLAGYVLALAANSCVSSFRDR